MSETMPAHSRLHRRGLILTATGGLALSFDMPLLRLGDGDVWSVLAVRSLCTFAVSIAVWLVLTRMFGRRIALIPGKAGLAAGVLYTLVSFTFLLAVFNTTTANVAFILAFTSMFAALVSWIALGERPSTSTLVSMAVMIGGVGLIVQDGVSSGHAFGNAMALLTAFLIGCALTISRASGKEMGLVPLVTAIVPAVAAFALLPDGPNIAHPAWILFDGLVMIPLALFCLASGPRYLSAPEVGMFYLLETVLAPVWIWIIFAETPSTATLAGGMILIVTLLAHSLWEMRRRRAEIEAAAAF